MTSSPTKQSCSSVLNTLSHCSANFPRPEASGANQRMISRGWKQWSGTRLYVLYAPLLSSNFGSTSRVLYMVVSRKYSCGHTMRDTRRSSPTGSLWSIPLLIRLLNSVGLRLASTVSTSPNLGLAGEAISCVFWQWRFQYCALPCTGNTRRPPANAGRFCFHCAAAVQGSTST